MGLMAVVAALCHEPQAFVRGSRSYKEPLYSLFQTVTVMNGNKASLKLSTKNRPRKKKEFVTAKHIFSCWLGTSKLKDFYMPVG